jgi:hypothetical protein
MSAVELNALERDVEQARAKFAGDPARLRSPATAGARTTASVPMLVPPPGRFSMTNGWPSRSDSHCPIRRATMSVAPPGASGTITRTGRVG